MTNLKKRKTQLGNDQTLGPDITDKMQGDKMIRENMAAGEKTLRAIKKLKGPGKHLGADD